VLSLFSQLGPVEMEKKKKTPRAQIEFNRQKRAYPGPNHDYFRRNFATLVRKHGGKWIVLANGSLSG
jgi:hypothetical protein